MPDNHIKPLEHFNPEKSMVNTRLYKKYDNYTKEIFKIEKELEDFLYITEDKVINNSVTNNFENPIIDVISECNKIQKGIIKNKRLLIAIKSTILFENLFSLRHRKSIIKIVKGIIKILLGIIIFIPQFILNIIKIKIYSE